VTETRTPARRRSGVAFNAADYLVDRHVRAGGGDRVALRCNGSDLSYAGLAELVARVSAGLTRLGARPEERVLMSMADSPELLAGILGAFRGGLVAVPVNTMLTGKDLTELLDDCRARVMLASSEFADAAVEAVAAAPGVTHLVVAGGAAERVAGQVRAGVQVVGWPELLTGLTPDDGPLADTLEDSPALWLYTSGTTGLPKAAMHRHANIRAVCETYGAQVLGIRPGDRCLSVAKLFFAYGLGNSALFPLSVGATTILEPRRATPDVIAERAAADAPTLFFGVPAFFAGMLSSGVPADALATVRLATSAGEALPAALQQRWTERFGPAILDGLGSTEALHIFLSNAPDDIGPGTSGRPVPGYQVQIRDETGQPVPAGVPGSLFVRGESIAVGYWCRTATTRQVFQGEWLATGDTYVQDEDGRYACLGRASDMIKAAGIWVSPAEVEGRLLEHADVLEAAVVAVPDGDGLDRPVAAVVLRAEATVSPVDLVEHCRAGLAHFKAPRAVLVVPSLPRTATGKLQRFRVREQSRSALAPAGDGATTR
jgi:benzoate-CoA ligase family protein